MAVAMLQEYQLERCSGTDAEQLAAGCQEYTAAERLNNGLWATILALGTVWTSMMIVQARSWRFFNVRPCLLHTPVPQPQPPKPSCRGYHCHWPRAAVAPPPIQP